jgi:hypothetical protein
MTEMLPELPIDPAELAFDVVGNTLVTTLLNTPTVLGAPALVQTVGYGTASSVLTNMTPAVTAAVTGLATGAIFSGSGVPLGFLTNTTTINKGLIDKLVPEVLTGPFGPANPVLGAIADLAEEAGLPVDMDVVDDLVGGIESLSDGVLNTVNAVQKAIFDTDNNGLLDSDGALAIATGAVGTASALALSLLNPANGTFGFVNQLVAAAATPVGPVLGVAFDAVDIATGLAGGGTGGLPLDIVTDLLAGGTDGLPLDIVTDLLAGGTDGLPLDIVTDLLGGEGSPLDIVTGEDGLLSMVTGGGLPLPLPAAPGAPGITAEDNNPLSIVTDILGGESNPLSAVTDILGEDGIVGSLTGGAAAGGALDMIVGEDGLAAGLTGGAGAGGALDLVLGDEGLLSGVVGGEGGGAADLLLGEDGLIGSVAGGLSIGAGLGGVVA